MLSGKSCSKKYPRKWSEAGPSEALITAGAPENPRKICSPWNPAPERNPGLKYTRIGAILKISRWKRSKIKKNLFRKGKTLNFVSIQWNYRYLLASLWGYLFNLLFLKETQAANLFSFCHVEYPSMNCIVKHLEKKFKIDINHDSGSGRGV
jgi:hypothetical protein